RRRSSPADPTQPIDPQAISESSKASRAKRVMGGIANASRFACDSSGHLCPRGFVTARKMGETLPLPSALNPVRALIDRFVPKWGQTRMLTFGLARGFDHPQGGNLIRHWRDPPDAPQAMIAPAPQPPSHASYS